MNKIIGLLLLFSLLFSGCGPQPSMNSPLVSNATPIPLTLEPCTVADDMVGAECGILHVPEDRSHPDGRYLDLDVVVVRAREPNPEPDPLFYIAGGPGEVATTTEHIATVKVAIFREVNARRDVVFMDQRGANEKHGLSCDPIPDDVANGTQQQMNDWIKTCLASLDGDPRFYTTAVAMRDLDDARAALGYDKINLYGSSYGATAVQVYMRMFPEHVRAAVLNHGTALDLPFFQAEPRASQSALDMVFTYCEQDEQCHAAYPDIREDWKKVLDRLAKGPVLTSYTPPGEDHPAQIDMEGFATSAHSGLLEPGGYAIMPYAIHALATNEDWTPILMSLSEQNGKSEPTESRFKLINSMIPCFEPGWGMEPDTIVRLNQDSYYRDEVVKNAKLNQKICAALPKPDPSLIFGPGKPAPLSVLILNSLLDPQNPPSNMDLALKEFTKSRIIVEPTEGHINTQNSICKWEIIAQYIEQGSVDGLDISCMEKQIPSFVIGD